MSQLLHSDLPDDGPISVAPRPVLDERISYYWHLGFPDTKIADHALDHFDRNVYRLRYVFQPEKAKLMPTIQL